MAITENSETRVLNKKAIAGLVGRRAKFLKADVLVVLDTLFDILEEELLNGNTISMEWLTLSTRIVKPFKTIHPATGEEIVNGGGPSPCVKLGWGIRKQFRKNYVPKKKDDGKYYG